MLEPIKLPSQHCIAYEFQSKFQLLYCATVSEGKQKVDPATHMGSLDGVRLLVLASVPVLQLLDQGNSEQKIHSQSLSLLLLPSLSLSAITPVLLLFKNLKS